MASLPPIDLPSDATGDGAFDAPRSRKAPPCSNICSASATTA